MNSLGQTLIIAGGIHSFGFAIFHIFFWKIFNWKKDLKKLSFGNRAIIQILNLRIIYLAFTIGVMCCFFSEALLTTILGRFIVGAISVFWLGRLIEQFIFLRVNHALVHVLTILFFFGFLFFFLALVL
jgi:hypothetical protein